MSPYITIILWITIWAGLVCGLQKGTTLQQINGATTYRVDKTVSFLIFLPIIIWAGTRTNFGDTETYRAMFHDVPTSIGAILKEVVTTTSDEGYVLFSGIIKLVIGNRDVIFFLIVALVQGICLVYVYQNYSINYVFSIFLFLISTDYLSWMFNGIRQFIAATIIFAATSLLLKKKIVWFVLAVLLASTFHASALVMLPIAYVVQGKAWNKKMVLLVSVSLISIIFIEQFTGILEGILSTTQYDSIMTDELWTVDNGTSFLRVLVYSAPALLSFVGRKQIQRAENPVIDLCTNMSIVTMGIYIVSMATSGIYIGRLPIYCSLYSYILLPWQIEGMFTKKSKPVVYTIVIVAFCIFYYYQLTIGWGVL